MTPAYNLIDLGQKNKQRGKQMKCNICEKKASKNNSAKYRSRLSGMTLLVHTECEWQVENDTRVIKESE